MYNKKNSLKYHPGVNGIDAIPCSVYGFLLFSFQFLLPTLCPFAIIWFLPTLPPPPVAINPPPLHSSDITQAEPKRKRREGEEERREEKREEKKREERRGGRKGR